MFNVFIIVKSLVHADINEWQDVQSTTVLACCDDDITAGMFEPVTPAIMNAWSRGPDPGAFFRDIQAGHELTRPQVYRG